MQTETDSARVAAMVHRHGDALLRVARRHSLCADDAHDALQRGLEIYLRRLDRVDPATELAWLKVVVKHEAMAVRRARADSVTGEEVDFDAHIADGQRSVEERAESGERAGRSAEALRRLKHDEALALMLKAEGLSYQEIGQRFGWTYTKVNRCITEGRRRFLRVYEDLETGAACEEYAPTLAALAAGAASSQQVVSLRPHLRHCGACRATMRELHAERRPRAAALFPIPALLAPLRWVQGLLQRAAASDVATTVQIASTGGGARGTGVAALVGLCLTGAGPTCLRDEPPTPPAKTARAEAPRSPAKPPRGRVATAAPRRLATATASAATSAPAKPTPAKPTPAKPAAPTQRIRPVSVDSSRPRPRAPRGEFGARVTAARGDTGEFASAKPLAPPPPSTTRGFEAAPPATTREFQAEATPAASTSGEFAEASTEASASSAAAARGEFTP